MEKILTKRNGNCKKKKENEEEKSVFDLASPFPDIWNMSVSGVKLLTVSTFFLLFLSFILSLSVSFLSLSFHNSWIHFPFDERDIRFNSCKKEESQKEGESEIVKGG